MSTAAAAPTRSPAVLYDIDWRTYSRLLHVLQSQGPYRLTYDRGTLEIMSPRFDHESPVSIIGSFIESLTDELNIPRRAGGAVTLRRKKKQRGLEADKCYWIASAPFLQGKTRLDLRIDPPPDLAIEVEVTARVINRMGIYAALGVPEVWVLNAGGLSFYALQGKTYQVRPNSLSFPALVPADLLPFLNQLGQTDDTTLMRSFRTWVRQQYMTRTPPTP
ncbi:MAG: Uma2 family endonuclease [Gemmataceae bacterium]|nr:Uma2 family endonuclease [Gemmataceae bacterium]